MSSEADVKRLVDAARKMNELLGRGAVPTNEWNAAYDWFRSALAPFAAERDAPAPVDLPPEGTRWIWHLNADHFYDVEIVAGKPTRKHRDGRPDSSDCMFWTVEELRNAPECWTEVPPPPSPSPSGPTPEGVDIPRPEVVANQIALECRAANTWAAAEDRVAPIITADRAAVTASLRAEVDAANKRINALLAGHEAIREDFRVAYEEKVKLRARLEALEADHLRACQTVAAMHAAAVGEVRGPIRGVVEDVAELRNTLTVKDHIIKQLQSDLSSAMVAKGKLIEERDDLEQARQLQYAEINRLNYIAEESKERMSATIADLEAKLDTPVCRLQFPDGSVPGNTAEAADGWYRVAQEYRAKLAAGDGVDKARKHLETADSLIRQMRQYTTNKPTAQDFEAIVVTLEHLHAALAAKGAERGE